jgi:hypothetical protein
MAGRRHRRAGYIRRLYLLCGRSRRPGGEIAPSRRSRQTAQRQTAEHEFVEFHDVLATSPVAIAGDTPRSAGTQSKVRALEEE